MGSSTVSLGIDQRLCGWCVRGRGGVVVGTAYDLCIGLQAYCRVKQRFLL